MKNKKPDLLSEWRKFIKAKFRPLGFFLFFLFFSNSSSTDILLRPLKQNSKNCSLRSTALGLDIPILVNMGHVKFVDF